MPQRFDFIYLIFNYDSENNHCDNDENNNHGVYNIEIIQMATLAKTLKDYHDYIKNMIMMPVHI